MAETTSFSCDVLNKGGGCGRRGRFDLMLAVAIGADRRCTQAMSDRLTVHAARELSRDF